MEQKIFQKSINITVVKILENNGLKEDSKGYLDKINKEAKTYFDILYKMINSFAIEGINEVLFLSDIQKELNISEQTAKNILKEVKEKILPLVITINEDEGEKESTTSTQSVRQTIESAKSTPPPQEIKEEISMVDTTPIIPVKKKMKKMIRTEEAKNIIGQSPQQEKKDDKYREPIG